MSLDDLTSTLGQAREYRHRVEVYEKLELELDEAIVTAGAAEAASISDTGGGTLT